MIFLNFTSMKLKLAFLSLLVSVSFGTLQAQNNLNIHLFPTYNNSDIEWNTTLTHANGYNFKITRLQYYLGDFIIGHDGGQQTTMDDVDNYVLASYDQLQYVVGVENITQVESIKFKVGVNDPPNHDDPSLYAAGHPLALHVPSMHWGWAGGYRFLVLHGECDTDNNGTFETGFEIQSIGDNLLTSVNTIPINNSEVVGNDVHVFLNYDLSNWIDTVDLATADISHGEGVIQHGLKDHVNDNTVFTERATSVGIEDNTKEELTIVVEENNIRYAVQEDQLPERITVVSLEGKTVVDHTELVNSGNIPHQLPAGMYIVNFLYNDHLLSEKVVIK